MQLILTEIERKVIESGEETRIEMVNAGDISRAFPYVERGRISLETYGAEEKGGKDDYPKAVHGRISDDQDLCLPAGANVRMLAWVVLWIHSK